MVNREALSICIQIRQQPLGGMYTFLDNWRSWLEAEGISCTTNLDADYTVLFVDSWTVPYAEIHRMKRERPRLVVVQRIDGSARDYGREDDADERQARVNMLADLTIFQSHYARYSTREKFRVIGGSGPVIYNPVDVAAFHPAPAGDPVFHPVRVCNASHSTNPMKGTARISSLAAANPDVEFQLCGNYPALQSLPNIHHNGRLRREALAAVMRRCHLFLHLAENEACPNVVLEALASGLPVLYRDSGGTPELVGDCGLPVTTSNFRVQLGAIIAGWPSYSRLSRDRAVERFSPERVFPQYLDSIVQARRHSLPGAMDILRAHRDGYPVLPWGARSLVWRSKRWLAARLKPGSLDSGPGKDTKQDATGARRDD